MPAISINSTDRIDIDQHFRVSAGPGAGKTAWLVGHIKHVLENSTRLGCAKKICCITYTNVAVDTILSRLDFVGDRLEVSTIHGFIYKHIIKPYGRFISSEYDLAIEKIDGHDDHHISQKRITEWIENLPNVSTFRHPYTVNQMTRMDNNKAGIASWLRSLSYQLNGQVLELAIDNSKAFYKVGNERRNLSKTNCLDKLRPGLFEYKKQFWRKGILHHDDVLFFGYQLLQRYPFILQVLRAKFPYFFIDEFQDTSPVQTAILRMIGQQNTSIGLIGDKAQSIFGFQGASPQDFTTFTLQGLQDYIIADNWRSSNEIVNLLNHVRSDILQAAQRNVSRPRPIVLVGNALAAYTAVETIVGTAGLATLSRDNITANAIKLHVEGGIPTSNLIDDFISTDSNTDRRRAIISCMNAIELANQKRFKEALKEMSRNFSESADIRKRKAFNALSILLSRYETFKNEPLIALYNLIKLHVKNDMARYNSGAAATFVNANTYAQVATGINLAEDLSLNRTIHKAKGDEFNSVLLFLKNDGALAFILNPNLTSEEHRIYYVAISRAKERLFINVPTLDPSYQTRLSAFFDFRTV